MKVIVICNPENTLFQNGVSIQETSHSEVDYYKSIYIIENNEFIVKEKLNNRILRLLYNIFWLILKILARDADALPTEEHERGYKKNKKIVTHYWCPVFRINGKIKIKPINCNDDTVITIWQLKTNKPFMYEVKNGEIEIIYNNREKSVLDV